ncbi:hypothetical protein [Pseudomonas sp. LRF_L74]|uniref:hypothetical protein n=1 Tax=Pseudomonas sp. LRF_L74 TaxID=3369422 RepID=UPI003F5E47A0
MLIPDFTIDHTQTLLYELEDITYCRKLKASSSQLDWVNLPIILDSPLVRYFTRDYWELDRLGEVKAQLQPRTGRNPLEFCNLLLIDHVAMVSSLAHVIASDWMCSRGHIVNYLKTMLGDERHDLLCVGYRAEDTRSRHIQHFGLRNGCVVIDDQCYGIQAQVHRSGRLVRFANGMRKSPSDNALRMANHRPSGSVPVHSRHVISRQGTKSMCGFPDRPVANLRILQKQK